LFLHHYSGLIPLWLYKRHFSKFRIHRRSKAIGQLGDKNHIKGAAQPKVVPNQSCLSVIIFLSIINQKNRSFIFKQVNPTNEI
jgi:hypothetical protein